MRLTSCGEATGHFCGASAAANLLIASARRGAFCLISLGLWAERKARLKSPHSLTDMFTPRSTGGS